MNTSIKFIGTGSGKTSLARFHSSILIERTNHKLLIDTGDGIARALLSARVPFQDIDSIFITHTHSDHFSGIASLITQMKLAERTLPLRIYIHENFTNVLSTILNAGYVFMEILGFDLKICGYKYDEPIEISNGLTATPAKNQHVRNRYCVDFSDEYFQSASLKLSLHEQKVYYTSDVGGIEDVSRLAAESPDILISEITHIQLAEILELLEKYPKMNLILTHIPDEFESKLKEKLAILEDPRVQLAHDGMEISTGK